MAKNLYVGNLSYSVDDDMLRALFELRREFEAFGKVGSIRLVMNRYTGKSKGFGFVEMSDDAEAQAAIDALNGKEDRGRVLTVNEARPREPRPYGHR